MANLDDVLTTLKNVVTAFNSFTNAFYAVDGITGASGIGTPTLVKKGYTRFVTLSVINAGSAAGTIHDTTSVATANSTNVICGIPTTAGVAQVYLICNNGLVVVPGSGQLVAVAYS